MHIYIELDDLKNKKDDFAYVDDLLLVRSIAAKNKYLANISNDLVVTAKFKLVFLLVAGCFKRMDMEVNATD